MLAHVADIEVALCKESIRWHDRFRDHAARVLEVHAVPFIRITSANAGKIRAGTFRSPLEGVIVHALGREAIGAIALDLIPKGTDHLAVANIAALADIDVAACLFERGVGAHPVHFFDG